MYNTLDHNLAEAEAKKQGNKVGDLERRRSGRGEALDTYRQIGR